MGQRFLVALIPIPGPEVIKLEYSLIIKVRHKDWLLLLDLVFMNSTKNQIILLINLKMPQIVGM